MKITNDWKYHGCEKEVKKDVKGPFSKGNKTKRGRGLSTVKRKTLFLSSK